MSAVLVEVWVRLQWDDKRGTPGFFLSDAVRGNRLAAGYDGWFAGVPVTINGLGFRDHREYSLAKAPGTFRILVFGDSVTFGHGTLSATTYPYLLEQRLKAWKPDVNWQVWNLGVPGYNTAQELAYLQEVGPRYQPDLVIVGFFANDLVDNAPPGQPTPLVRARHAVLRQMQRRLYSTEFYKRVFLTARWRFMTAEGDRQRLASLADQQALLSPAQDASARPEQRLGPVDTFDDRQVRDFVCIAKSPGDGGRDSLAAVIRGASTQVTRWTEAVQGFQRLQREGAYRVMFFINMAPDICPQEDRFHNAGSLDDEAALLSVLEDGTPVASSSSAFLHYRPSQMPGAGNHSIGNANRVKADALFDFLQTRVLPLLLTEMPHTETQKH
jgi:lysophospholipase L1-like esterase